MDIHDPELDPILMAGELAHDEGWVLEQVDKDCISIQIVGDWHKYSLTVAWHRLDEEYQILRVICTFAVFAPAERIRDLYNLLNKFNTIRWSSNFTFDEISECIVLKRGLEFRDDMVPSQDCIGDLIFDTVSECDKYHPVISAVLLQGKTVNEAMFFVMDDPLGSA